jgi:hypothetical protein
MKLGGYRLDGTLRVLIPGGLTVVLRDDLASPPLDERDADTLGPWIDPPVSLSEQERQDLAKRLDRARVVPAHTFVLAKGKAADEEAAESPDEEAAEPPGDDAPIDKGALLDTIKRIAVARAKEKDQQAIKAATLGLPRFGKKKFKLEYEVEDSQAGGESDKDKDKKKPPTSEAPDALALGAKP